MTNSDPFQYQYRASELGACIKRLAADRMGKKRSENAYAPMAKAFARGNAHETACKAVMRDEGWVFDESTEVEATGGGKGIPVSLGVTVNDELYFITGHLDSMTKPPGMLEALPLAVGEIKAPGAYERFLSNMYSAEPEPLTELYKWQTSVYMHAKNTELYMICLDDDFKIHYHGFEQPFYTLEDIKNRIGDVEAIVAEGRLPKLCSIRNFPCPFYHLHEDEKMEYTVDSAMDEVAERRAKAKVREKEAKDDVAYCNGLIKELMGEDTDRLTENTKVTISERVTNKYNYKKMAADGIDVEAYKTTSKSNVLNVTYRGESDG